jgi:O-acetyl-ADP-ribose deacetylase (regulator of RNase III)
VKARRLKVGALHVYRLPPGHLPCYIINFPTKYHWREKSDYGQIQIGLARLRRVVEQRAIGSIAIPALGCGLGGLDWDKVEPMIEEAFDGVSCEVELYEPDTRPVHG